MSVHAHIHAQAHTHTCKHIQAYVLTQIYVILSKNYFLKPNLVAHAIIPVFRRLKQENHLRLEANLDYIETLPKGSHKKKASSGKSTNLWLKVNLAFCLNFMIKRCCWKVLAPLRLTKDSEQSP